MMENSCGCNNQSPVEKAGALQADQIAQCPATVHETVCVQAEVTITPNVVVGDVQSFCIGSPIIGSCPGTPTQRCVFRVSQNICVQIPLTFSADAIAVPRGIVCGTPSPGGCPVVPPPFVCCAFIKATQGATAEGDPLPSLSIQLCGPANQCSPQGNHINIQFPAEGPNFEINLAEMLSMACDTPATGLVTVLAQAVFRTGAGASELANFTFVFNPFNNTVHIVATSVTTGDTLLDTTITLTGNVQFAPCTPAE